MIEPLELITRLREIYPDKYEEHSNGCLKFHLLLKALYPNATGWYDGLHFVTEIDGISYDIDGIAERTDKYLPLAQCHNDWSMFTKTKRLMEIL